ncbi:LacI family DNA-binding transcriptional regulator [Ohessyouella blattaphilus]|uniref:LacI family DNA-binding transcriptional regulator n=1 Tax=Ohessyouella blattaphilus TaxID=2949333 RepID=A0ABT1EE17_9FIRM|nr:LacI family DNA-binding transcriptional regulator [Ohessyouella blattaphilus]MCP1108933.1 LacI family DNA-binding transcriptional regulator [Ohessyouella blattaphilus]MCR8562327.1 LacI family DNA-binding transcriptional regulator [Ohessyouella blattaphilus]
MTNKELAKMLNISQATLSMVLNNKPGISENTRKKVLAGVESLGYGNMIKKDDKPVDLKNICFIIYKRHGEILNQHPFFLLLIEGIESYARKHGYNLLFRTIDRSQDLTQQINELNQLPIEGAIIFATEMFTDDILPFQSLAIPYVVLDNDWPNLNLDSVDINQQMGTFQAIKYLVDKGHTNIGYLKSVTKINSFSARHRGFEEALNSFDLKLNPKYIYSVRYTEDGSYIDSLAFLTKKAPLPTAFVTDDDTIASGFIKACKEVGLSVPEDISIVGFNDRPLCEIVSPSLTTIHVPKHSYGANAFHLLQLKIQSEEDFLRSNLSSKIRIGTRLVERESVAAK